MTKAISLPTMADVARLAGVSPATVSYVLSGRRGGAARFSDETRERVLSAAAELGYAPNQAARSLRRRRTERVCLVAGLLNTPFMEALACQFDLAAEAHGYMSVILMAGTPERGQQVFEQLRRGLADGIYVASSTLTDDQIVQLAGQDLAIVVQSNSLSLENVDLVRLPNAQASYEAVCYLIAHGHRRIGYLGFGPLDPPSERYAAYLRALAERGLASSRELCAVHAHASRQDAFRAATGLLDARPSAIFADTDLAAVSAIWAIHQARLRIPQDVAVIGLGNIPDGEITSPPLTTIGPRKLDFCASIDMLFSRLANGVRHPGRTESLTWEIIERGSV